MLQQRFTLFNPDLRNELVWCFLKADFEQPKKMKLGETGD